MKLSKEEFRRLQQEWYAKLSDHGFTDAEKLVGDSLVLAETAHYKLRRDDQATIACKEEYFRRMSQMANDEDTEYANSAEQLIIVRHCDGAQLNAIVSELAAINVSMTRHTVRYIIRRYQHAWDIRSYDRKMLRGKRSYTPKVIRKKHG